MNEIIKRIILQVAAAQGNKIVGDNICSPTGANCQSVEKWINSGVAAYSYSLRGTIVNLKKTYMESVCLLQMNGTTCWAATGITLKKLCSTRYDNIKSEAEFFYNEMPSDISAAKLAKFLDSDASISIYKNDILQMSVMLDGTKEGTINFLNQLNERYTRTNLQEKLCKYVWGVNSKRVSDTISFYNMAIYYKKGMSYGVDCQRWFGDYLGFKYEYISEDDLSVSGIKDYLRHSPFIIPVYPEIILYTGKDAQKAIKKKNPNKWEELFTHYIIIFDILQGQYGDYYLEYASTENPFAQTGVCDVAEIMYDDFIFSQKYLNDISNALDKANKTKKKYIPIIYCEEGVKI